MFDEVDVEVAVESERPVQRVELRFDGALVGRRTSPPWRWTVDVGPQNRARVLYADVFFETGVPDRAELLAPRFETDEEIDLGLRQLYATVTDRSGRRVSGLDKKDFTVLDDGEEQELVTFEGGDIPFTAVLLVDSSQSVLRRAFGIALRGARSFVESLREHDEVKLLFFGDRITGSTRWNGPDDDVEAQLDSLAEGLTSLSGSAIIDHLHLALLRAETRNGRRVVIALTDGWDLHSVLRAEQVAEVARRSQAQIFIIRWGRIHVRITGNYERLLGVPSVNSSLRSAHRARRDYVHLEEIARSTGGRVLDITGIDQVDGALKEILGELREQYALGYYPSDRRRDGSWHEVEILVKDRGLDVRTRGTYVDD